MARQLEVIKLCAPHPSFTRQEAFIGTSGAFDKLSDLKLKGPASEMLMAIAEAVGPQLVAVLIHRKAGPHKNPKVLTDGLMFIGQLIESFGLNYVPGEWVGMIDLSQLLVNQT